MPIWNPTHPEPDHRDLAQSRDIAQDTGTPPPAAATHECECDDCDCPICYPGCC